jgi:hypothetical protein
MNALIALLAQVEFPTVTKAWNRANGTTREMMVLFVAIAVVTAVVVIWAVYFRKRKGDGLHRFPKSRRRLSTTATADEAPLSRRRKKRRAGHAMNPTLAQTGGLPPARAIAEPDTVRAE